MFVDLCAEDAVAGMCGRLLKSMYGNRDAAANWEDFSMGVAVLVGFTAGVGNPCILNHEKLKVRMFKHGDDFILSGKRSNVQELTTKLMEHIALTDKGRLGWGPELGYLAEAKILNRIIRVSRTTDGTPFAEVESDPRHVEIILKQLQLQVGSKGRNTPGEPDGKGMPDLTLISASESTQYRSLVMRANYLSEDRYDIRFACKELARDMQKPTIRSMHRLKNLGRYLLSKPRVVLRMHWQGRQSRIIVHSDSDWAGCPITRRSTSAGVIMHGEHFIKGYSSTQISPATSSGEAEYNAGVRASSAGLGIVAYASDLGCVKECHVGLDSSAALGIMKRTGLGKVRHLALPLLWLQAAVRNGRIHPFKEPGETNVADAGTKYLAGPRLWELVQKLGYHELTGSSNLALKAQV